MEDIRHAFIKKNASVINAATKNGRLVTPIFYKEFLDIDGLAFSNRTMALYATGPLEVDVQMGEDLDPLYLMGSHRYGRVSLSMKAARWFYSYFMKYPKLFLTIKNISPFKQNFPYDPSQHATWMAWLLSLVSGYSINPRTEEQLLLDHIWRNKGKLQSGDEQSITDYDTLPPSVIYMLFYFRDVIPDALTTLSDILSKTTRMQELDVRFYIDMYEAMTPEQFTSFMSFPVFDKYYFCLLDSSLRTNRFDYSWTDDEVARLVITHMSDVDARSYWIDQLTENEDIRQMFKRQRKVEKLVFHAQQTPYGASFLSCAPLSLASLWLDRYPKLSADILRDRGVLLNESILSLVQYYTSSDTITDVVNRYRGTKEGLMHLMSLDPNNPIYFYYGMVYKDENITLRGVTNIKAVKDVTTSPSYVIDDLLLSKKASKWQSYINRYLPDMNRFRMDVIDDLQRILPILL